MLIFVTPDTERPIGGIKQIYRHVEILNRSGIEATVLHQRKGFVCRWFRHDARVAYSAGWNALRAARERLSRHVAAFRQGPPKLDPGDVILIAEGKHLHKRRVDPTDLLVYPEYFGRQLESTLGDLPFAIFNQNVHGTFRGYGLAPVAHSTIYRRPQLRAVVVVSAQNLEYIQYAFPGLRVLRVINGVDSSIFHPQVTPKRRQIAIMPRKLGSHLEEIIQILNSRGCLEGWSICPIDAAGESEVAQKLCASMIFLSTCSDEGFGLPPLEAGMSGCWVVGYTGTASAEFFVEGLSSPVPQGDSLAFARAAESAIEIANRQPELLLRKGLSFSEALTRRYSMEEEARTVVKAWSAVAR